MFHAYRSATFALLVLSCSLLTLACAPTIQHHSSPVRTWGTPTKRYEGCCQTQAKKILHPSPEGAEVRTETEIGTWRLSQSGGAGIKSSVEDHPRYGKRAIIFVYDGYVINTIMFVASKSDLEFLNALINKIISEISVEISNQPINQRDGKKTKRVKTVELGAWQDSIGNSIRFSVEDHPRYGKQAKIFVSDEYVIETVLFTGISNVDLTRLKTLIDETIPEL